MTEQIERFVASCLTDESRFGRVPKALILLRISKHQRPKILLVVTERDHDSQVDAEDTGCSSNLKENRRVQDLL